ncbi:MAG TPA: amidase [Polyangiaceae bacterium]|jgi:aspartyl-tRNA(Asn)/glutamyl-tRNA(Gln) amidotransferase subunit A
MLTAPRISGTWLRSLARFARTRAGSSALEIALRAELGISALSDLSSSLYGAFPLDNRARSGRPPRRLENLGLGLPKSGWSKTSADFVAAYESRRATPERIAGRVLERAAELARMRPSMRVLLDVAEEDAKNDAESSGDRYRVGAPKGPLDGVCVVVKEQTRVRGMPARGGTAYMDGAPQKEDATVVRRLREAGAIIVGTTPMTELGMTPLGFNPHRRMPRNPHDPGHVAGGSSTGTGVAVATGLVPIGLGADGGGSIRIPAACNGVFGIKPTWGRVSRAGDLFAGTVAHLGPLASSTADLARVLEVIGAPDARDPETAAAPPLPQGSLVAALGRGVRGLTIGVEEGEWGDASPEVAAACREALRALEKEGARIKTVSSPLMRHAPAVGYLAISIETRAEARRDWLEHGDEMSPDLQITMAVVEELGGVEMAEAMRLRSGLRNEAARMLGEVDVLALPTLVRTAPAVTDAQFESGFLDPQALGGLCRFNFFGNLTGLPALSAPVGKHGALPIGLQLVGDAWDEATILAASAHLERLGVAKCERPKISVDVWEA